METKERRIIINNEADNSISVVELKVQDKDCLREIRNRLLKYGIFDKECNLLDNYILLHSKEAVSFSKLLTTGYSDCGKFLIRQHINSIDKETDICDYTKDVYYCTHLNSILLFSSLLGELDVFEYCKYSDLVKQFIANGIIKCSNFYDIWQTCSNSLVNFGSRLERESDFAKIKDTFKLTSNDSKLFNSIKKDDLYIFRTVLKSGLLCYDVIDSYSASSNESNFRGFTAKDIQQINVNTAILLGDKKCLKKIK